MDQTQDRGMTVQQRLAANANPERERVGRQNYLRWKRAKMPRLVAHQERMMAGMSGSESLLVDYEEVTP